MLRVRHSRPSLPDGFFVSRKPRAVSNLVGGAFQIDLPSFAGQRALESQEETARALVVVLGWLRGQAFPQLLVIARVTVFVHALTHHVHLKRARTNPLKRSTPLLFLFFFILFLTERKTHLRDTEIIADILREVDHVPIAGQHQHEPVQSFGK